jgi:1,2-phenylacetyl-CoA epoxidase PaaB subunit
VRFFFDNNLSPKLARSLDKLVEPQHQVVHLKDRFAANTADEVWMRALAGEEGWIIVSGDLRIRKNPHEIKAWTEAGHTTFFLKKGWIDLTFWEQAWKFAKVFPDMIAAAERAPRGMAFMITPNGKIEG